MRSSLRTVEQVLIERELDEPMTYETFRGASTTDPGCLERHRVTHCGSYVALSGRKMCCHAQAPDAEAVRTTSRILQAPFSRICTAVHLFSYVQRGGDRYVGIFENVQPEARQGDGLMAWPAFVRFKKPLG